MLKNKKKFDLRVLAWANTSGDIYIYHNILYRFSLDEYKKNSLDLKIQLTGTAFTENYKDRKQDSFFSFDKLNEIDSDIYIKQLVKIIPKIIERLNEAYNHCMWYQNQFNESKSKSILKDIKKYLNFIYCINEIKYITLVK